MKKSVTMPLSIFALDSGMTLTKIRVLAALMALEEKGVVAGRSQRAIARVVGMDSVRTHLTLQALRSDGAIAIDKSDDGLQYTVTV